MNINSEADRHSSAFQEDSHMFSPTSQKYVAVIARQKPFNTHTYSHIHTHNNDKTGSGRKDGEREESDKPRCHGWNKTPHEM